MPEHTPDPIDRLQSLRNGGLAVSPLPPEEVRRLGTRRRTRRHVGIAVASAAVVIAAVVPATLIATRDNSNGSHQIGPIDNPTATTTSAVPQVISYPEPGIEVTDPAGVDKLTGTTPEFQAFIAEQVRLVKAEGAACPDAFHGVTVQKYSSAGYAIGGVNSCGGYMALWVNRDDHWQEGYRTQDTWDCETLSYLGVPKSFVGGQCADEAGDFGPNQVGEVKLGMTEAEIRAIGGQVTPSPGGESCRGLLLPFHQPIPNQSDGSFSETRGLVGITARSGMKTPERIGRGSSLAKLRAAYPTAHQGQDEFWVVDLPGNTEYAFWIAPDSTVDAMILTMTNQDCLAP